MWQDLTETCECHVEKQGPAQNSSLCWETVELLAYLLSILTAKPSWIGAKFLYKIVTKTRRFCNSPKWIHLHLLCYYAICYAVINSRLFISFKCIKGSWLLISSNLSPFSLFLKKWQGVVITEWQNKWMASLKVFYIVRDGDSFSLVPWYGWNWKQILN